MGRFYKTSGPKFLDYMNKLPEKAMEKAIATTDAKISTAEDLIQKLPEYANVDSIRADEDAKKGILQGFSDRSDDITGKIQNTMDYLKYMPDLKRLKRDIHDSKTSGDLFYLQGRYDQRTALKKHLDEQNKKDPNKYRSDDIKKFMDFQDAKQDKFKVGGKNYYNAGALNARMDVNDYLDKRITGMFKDKESHKVGDAVIKEVGEGKYVKIVNGTQEFIKQKDILNMVNALWQGEEIGGFVGNYKSNGVLSDDDEKRMKNAASIFLAEKFGVLRTEESGTLKKDDYHYGRFDDELKNPDKYANGVASYDSDNNKTKVLEQLNEWAEGSNKFQKTSEETLTKTVSDQFNFLNQLLTDQEKRRAGSKTGRTTSRIRRGEFEKLQYKVKTGQLNEEDIRKFKELYQEALKDNSIKRADGTTESQIIPLPRLTQDNNIDNNFKKYQSVNASINQERNNRSNSTRYYDQEANKVAMKMANEQLGIGTSTFAAQPEAVQKAIIRERNRLLQDKEHLAKARQQVVTDMENNPDKAYIKPIEEVSAVSVGAVSPETDLQARAAEAKYANTTAKLVNKDGSWNEHYLNSAYTTIVSGNILEAGGKPEIKKLEKQQLFTAIKSYTKGSTSQSSKTGPNGTIITVTSKMAEENPGFKGYIGRTILLGKQQVSPMLDSYRGQNGSNAQGLAINKVIVSGVKGDDGKPEEVFSIVNPVYTSEGGGLGVSLKGSDRKAFNNMVKAAPTKGKLAMAVESASHSIEKEQNSSIGQTPTPDKIINELNNSDNSIADIQEKYGSFAEGSYIIGDDDKRPRFITAKTTKGSTLFMFDDTHQDYVEVLEKDKAKVIAAADKYIREGNQFKAPTEEAKIRPASTTTLTPDTPYIPEPQYGVLKRN